MDSEVVQEVSNAGIHVKTDILKAYVSVQFNDDRSVAGLGEEVTVSCGGRSATVRLKNIGDGSANGREEMQIKKRDISVY